MPSRRLHYSAKLFDGRNSQPFRIEVSLSRAGVGLIYPDGKAMTWPYRSLRMSPGGAGNLPVQLEHDVQDAGQTRTELLVVEDKEFLENLQRLAPRVLDIPWAVPGSAQKRWALVAGVLVAFIILITATLGVLIPTLADQVAMQVPVAWEEKLGEQVRKALDREPDNIKDPEINQAVEDITRRLLDTVPDQPYNIRVYINKQKIVNAIALPGGAIILYKGLLDATETPEELAGVLAHELQHVLLRHSTRSIIRSMAASVLISLLIGDTSQVMGVVLEIARNLEGLRHNREMESEADREGMKMILAARVDPQGMVRMFETLQKEEEKLLEKFGEDIGAPEHIGEEHSWLEYLSTHPAGKNRVDMLKQMMAESTVQPEPLLPGTDWKLLLGESLKIESSGI